MNINVGDKEYLLLKGHQKNDKHRFTPKDGNSYEIRDIAGDDALFVQSGKTQLFDDNKIMFPLLSHA